MARLKPELVPPEELTDDDIAALVGIARRQAALRDELKAALLACDDQRALDAARRLVGVAQGERGQ